MTKVIDDIAPALNEHLRDGMTIAVGGFGLCGIPSDLIRVVRDSGVKDLTIVSNNLGVDGKGLGLLLENDQISQGAVRATSARTSSSCSSTSTGDSTSSSSPQGTLAERLRAGGSGIPAFYTRRAWARWSPKASRRSDFDGAHVRAGARHRRRPRPGARPHRRHATATSSTAARRATSTRWRHVRPGHVRAGRDIVALGGIDPDAI
jgi:3-oxoacid CoA-transferase subunit A